MEKQLNPYITSWFKPVVTIEKVIKKKVSFTYQIPLILAGLSSFLGELNNVYGIGLLGPIFILFFGTAWIYLVLAYLFPFLILKVGKLWKGTAEFSEIQKIVALAQIPVIIALIYQGILFTFGEILGYDEINYAIQLIVWLFSIRILIIGIAKAQEFSYGLALLNILMCVLPLFIVELIVM